MKKPSDISIVICARCSEANKIYYARCWKCSDPIEKPNQPALPAQQATVAKVDKLPGADAILRAYKTVLSSETRGSNVWPQSALPYPLNDVKHAIVEEFTKCADGDGAQKELLRKLYAQLANFVSDGDAKEFGNHGMDPEWHTDIVERIGRTKTQYDKEIQSVESEIKRLAAENNIEQRGRRDSIAEAVRRLTNKKQLMAAWIISTLLFVVVLFAPRDHLVQGPGGRVFRITEKTDILYKSAIPSIQWDTVLQRSFLILIIGSMFVYTLRDKK
ncbi:MAG: hypothetical protein Q8R76_00300 [Candidatus Omnitrophota bacterium]|nr:hypothetical protein [Candidatus Omnitrophota bacterium]